MAVTISGDGTITGVVINTANIANKAVTIDKVDDDIQSRLVLNVTSSNSAVNIVDLYVGLVLPIGDARSSWSSYTAIRSDWVGALATDCINNSTTTFTLSRSSKVFLLRLDGWNPVDLTGWVSEENSVQYLGAANPTHVYSKILAAGNHTLNNDSAMYIFT